MSTGPAYVYFETSNTKTGKSEFVFIPPEQLTRSKLYELSTLASKRLGWGHGTGKKEIILNEAYFDRTATTKILNAKVGNNIVKPTPLTVSGLGIGGFDELVATYRNAQMLDLKREFKGDDLRNTIIAEIKKKPLTFARFQQMIEELDFDTGIASIVKNAVMFGEVKGKAHKCPESHLIKAYAIKHEQEYGLWTELQDIQASITAKMNAQNVAKQQAQGKALKVKDYGGEFPALPGKQ